MKLKEKSVCLENHAEQEATWAISSIRFWTILLIVCQFLDGFLTYFCITHSPLGIHGEGNLILRYMMHNIGLIQTIILSKTIAIVGCVLLSPKRSKFELTIIRGLVFIYTGVILSWLYVLNNILFL